MRNAHLRLGRLEYRRTSGKTDTKFSVPLDHYIGEDKDAHLISVYGGDAEVGAISSAIAERHTFTVYFCDGRSKVVGLGTDAVCYRGHINLPERKRGARHLVAVSAAMQANGTAGLTILPQLRPETYEMAWATLVSLLGLPGDPHWSHPVLRALWVTKKVRKLDGIGCTPVAIKATRNSMMRVIGNALKEGRLSFPENNGPILWPTYSMKQLLAPPADADETA
jgi:hypothetical protein